MAKEWPAIPDIVKRVVSKQSRAQEMVGMALQNLDEHDEYKATIATLAERAQKKATELDALIERGETPGRLAGVPFVAKDNFLTFGAKTTAASNMLKNFDAPYQATAIERLEAEGAICVAKSNLDAFAHGSSTENSDFFTTHNPHDKSRVPGGSSGGSAAAVALRCVPFALGTDTGGSIRLPAAFCGVVGYKPTYGLVSRSGVVAMASSTDVIGPLANSVQDAAYVLDVIAGRDPLDATTIERSVEDMTDLAGTLRGKKFGIIKEHAGAQLQKEVALAIEHTVQQLKDAGAEITEISLASLSLALACYYIICPAEVSSNLSRYDGQRFGYRSPEAKNLETSYLDSRSYGFGAEAKRRIMIGTYVLSSGYYDAYYRRAMQVRSKLIQEFNAAFEEVDFLVGPTAPVTAFHIGEHAKDPLAMYLTDLLTVGANLVGNPAISLPVNMSDSLPIGLQIMAPARHDRELLAVAKQTEEII